ncbi:MAG: RidA family protein [Puniceicoccaceae bacterium]
MGTFEMRLQSLGLQLPVIPTPKGSYLPYQWSNGLLYVSGQLSIISGGDQKLGPLTHQFDLEEATTAAQIACLNTLSTIKRAIGNLDCVKRFVFLNGYVQAEQGFADSPKVINGASDLLLKVFGEKGGHARAAIAVAGLPLNATVEIQVSLEVK